MKTKKIFLIIFIGVLLACGSFLAYRYYVNLQETKRQQALLEKRKIAWDTLRQQLTEEISQFKGEAGIVVKDLQTNWEFSHHQDKLFPSASLVKIPIMASLFYAVNEGRIKLGETLILQTRHKVAGSGSLKDFPFGTKLSIEKLIELMITESDNSATNMLIELLGFDYLNAGFKKLGLPDTGISRKMMDFKSRRAGVENYTTAQDLASLLAKIYNGNLIDRDTSFKCLELLKRQKISDRIPAELPVDTIVAHKTGLEKDTCHDVGVVFTNQGNFLICVLTRHKDKNSKKAREFIARIALLAYNYLGH